MIRFVMNPAIAPRTIHAMMPTATQAGVPGQLLGRAEAVDVADLRGDCGGQDPADAGQVQRRRTYRCSAPRVRRSRSQASIRTSSSSTMARLVARVPALSLIHISEPT